MSIVKRGWIIVLLTSASACGSSTTPTATPTPTPTATTLSLTGQVMDSTTSTSISGATVSIADGANAGKSATTDGSGNYSFTGLQAAAFTVTVSANNYVSQSRAVSLTSSQALSFQLTRATVTLNGTVTDGTSGGILPNILVQITDGANAGRSVRTDGNGTYSIGGVAPATFTLSVSAVSYDTLKRQVTIATNTRVDFVLQRTALPPPPVISDVKAGIIYTGLPTGGDTGLYPDAPLGSTCSVREADGAPMTVSMTVAWDGLEPKSLDSKAFPAGVSSSPEGARLFVGFKVPNQSKPHAVITCVATNNRGQTATRTTEIR